MQASKITTRQVFDKLNAMDEATRGRMSAIEEKHASMDKVVHGNGEPGLNERVRTLESYMRESRNTQRLVLGAVALDLIARFMNLI